MKHIGIKVLSDVGLQVSMSTTVSITNQQTGRLTICTLIPSIPTNYNITVL